MSSSGVVISVFNEEREERHDPRDKQYIECDLELLTVNFILNIFGVSVVQKESWLIHHHEYLETETLSSKEWNTN